MKVINATIYDLAGKPLADKAMVELEEEEGVSVWGGYFRLPTAAPPIEAFKPQCVLKLEDGRQGKVTLGRTERHAAYFLGNGKLEKAA